MGPARLRGRGETTISQQQHNNNTTALLQHAFEPFDIFNLSTFNLIGDIVGHKNEWATLLREYPRRLVGIGWVRRNRAQRAGLDPSETMGRKDSAQHTQPVAQGHVRQRIARKRPELMVFIGKGPAFPPLSAGLVEPTVTLSADTLEPALCDVN